MHAPPLARLLAVVLAAALGSSPTLAAPTNDELEGVPSRHRCTPETLAAPSEAPCIDPTTSRVVVAPIAFDGDRLAVATLPRLRAVAALLTAVPALTRVEVVFPAEPADRSPPTGTHPGDAIVRALVDAGVSGTRVTLVMDRKTPRTWTPTEAAPAAGNRPAPDGILGFVIVAWRGRETAAAHQRCRDDGHCEGRGGCTSVQGECVPVRASDCRRSSVCAAWGECRFDGRRDCVAGSPRDCAASTGCVDEGRCSLVGDRCQVATSADCARTADCRVHGHCAWGGDRCVAKSPDACRRSEQCASDGRCSLVEATPGAARKMLCLPATDLDCAASSVCREDGRCHAEQQRCVRPAEAP